MLEGFTEDLWDRLQKTNKQIALWGMGNGADKILSVLKEREIPVACIFASDGFARGNLFHGMPVETYSAVKERFGAEHLTVLLSFGSSRPDVLENVLRVASECELYAPDVPAFGDGLFDRAFFCAHREELLAARALLSDGESRRIFDSVLHYKLTGDVRTLLEARSDEEEVWRELLQPACIRSAADLGAYNGDTVRELIERTEGKLSRVWAMEPDARNYQKLKAYADGEERTAVTAVHAGAWSQRTTLTFDKSGNRNASFLDNRSQTLSQRPVKTVEVAALPLDEVLGGAHVDYIKYDVEGAEREALLGSVQTVTRCHPTLMVSLYHRNEDLFSLPLLIHSLFPRYGGFYLRRFGGVPAWDLNLYVKEK